MDPIKEKSKCRLTSSILMTLLLIAFYQVYFRIEIKEVDDIEQGLFGLSVLDETTGQTIPPSSTTAVSVGDEMRISVTAKDPAILDFYLSECTATNGKDPSASDYKSLQLIEDDGCMVDHSAIWPSNAPASPNPGQYIDYRQFGFASISGSKSGRIYRQKNNDWILY